MTSGLMQTEQTNRETGQSDDWLFFTVLATVKFFWEGVVKNSTNNTNHIFFVLMLFL